MKNSARKILIISPFFSPNIGGVESHLDDLVSILSKQESQVFVETLSPITTPNVDWSLRAIIGKVQISRTQWYGQGLFPKIEGSQILSMMYLTPAMLYLVLKSFLKYGKIKVVHAHGINAALACILLKWITGAKLVVSIHAIYAFDRNSISTLFIKSILNKADVVLTLSDASANELREIGVASKVSRFKYWIDLNLFSPRKDGKYKEFSVIFVGRLIEKKGVRIFLETAKLLPKINFFIIGSGPLGDIVYSYSKNFSNIYYLGGLSNTDTANEVKKCNLLCIPSLYEEGFGRVTMEAVACGLPIIGANRGGIPEAVNDTVSILGEITIDFLYENIKLMSEDEKYYEGYAGRCRRYALENFSDKNAQTILDAYS